VSCEFKADPKLLPYCERCGRKEANPIHTQPDRMRRERTRCADAVRDLLGTVPNLLPRTDYAAGMVAAYENAIAAIGRLT
jgi:hypothetical protein